MDTYENKAFMGEDSDTKEKMLIKSNDEFTSLIQKVYKVQEDFIVLTENSIYIDVDNEIFLTSSAYFCSSVIIT